jgi:hypothetical protein
MLIQLNDGCYVAAEEIAEVTVSDYGHITVRMKSGVGHHVTNEWGDRSGSQTMTKLVAQINAAKKEQP